MLIRPATPDDLDAIDRIQAAAPEAAHWKPADYLRHHCIVAVEGESIVAFLVSSDHGEEREILNIAVDPRFRRHGFGRALVQHELQRPARMWFLEVRESNQGARRLYTACGFRGVGRRLNYYDNPPEGAIVMRFFS